MADPQPAWRLLLVDDDEVFRKQLARAFSLRGCAVTTACDAAAALEVVASQPLDGVVVDLKMPGASGLDVVDALHARFPDLPVVVLTGYGSIATAVDAIKRGAANYLQKPASADQILRALSLGEPRSAAATVTPSPAEAPSLARTEWEHIQRVLADTDNNISEAARRLGLHRRSLQRKLQKYPPRR